jgi:hypothetical protein
MFDDFYMKNIQHLKITKNLISKFITNNPDVISFCLEKDGPGVMTFHLKKYDPLNLHPGRYRFVKSSSGSYKSCDNYECSMYKCECHST